jgi:excisionase family DNA binding protein
MAATVSRDGLKAVLLLAAEGAATGNARLAGAAEEAWQALAMSATRRGPATIVVGDSPPKEAPREWMTVAAAARVMGVSARQVQRLARSGAVRARRHGARAWLIDPDSAGQWRKAA